MNDWLEGLEETVEIELGILDKRPRAVQWRTRPESGVHHAMNAPINIDALSPEQKLELIAELWDSLTRDSEPVGVPDWHREELDRRLERMSAQPSEGLSFDGVVESARKSLRQDQ